MELVNPWFEYINRSNKSTFHPNDEAHAMAFNSAMSKRKSFLLADYLEPFPYLGNPKAPVYVLLANPGKNSAEDKRTFKYSARNLELIKQNLLHEGNQPFLFRLNSPENPNLESSYFKQRTAKLVSATSLESVINNVFFINFHAYHSKSWYAIPFTFYSQKYSFELVRSAVKRNALIIMSRNMTGWITAVPELADYEHIFTFKSSRSVHLSEKNLGTDRKSTRLNSSHVSESRMPSSA